MSFDSYLAAVQSLIGAPMVLNRSVQEAKRAQETALKESDTEFNAAQQELAGARSKSVSQYRESAEILSTLNQRVPSSVRPAADVPADQLRTATAEQQRARDAIQQLAVQQESNDRVAARRREEAKRALAERQRHLAIEKERQAAEQAEQERLAALRFKIIVAASILALLVVAVIIVNVV